MKSRYRALARVGATALLASGMFATAGAPAIAAGTQTDLELSVVGTKLAKNVQGKLGWAKITNKGKNTPSKLNVVADLSHVDPSRVIALPAAGVGCASGGGLKISCQVPADQLPGPGQTVEVSIFVFKPEGGQRSYSAPVTFSIDSPDDTDESNNSKTTKLSVGEESGVDLAVLVPDVKERSEGTDGQLVPGEAADRSELRPGDRAFVEGSVFNWGNQAALGLKVEIQLPEQVTFAESMDFCEYRADRRSATCTYRDMVLPGDALNGGGLFPIFFMPVQVAEGAAGPVVLDGGSWRVEALGQGSGPQVNRSSAKPLPKNVKLVSADSVAVNEVDTSDNVDDFAVIVAGNGNGGGNGGGGDNGGGDGNGGGGGGLPVTGAQAGLIGGIGVAVLVAGGVMFLMARRRRVVLVTPGDEKPSA